MKVRGQEASFALKVLSRNQLEKLNILHQLYNEIEILKSCSHENIIKLVALFESDDYIFMLMELAEEGNLFEKLKKVNKFKEDQVRGYMKDVIKAIVYLHEKNPPIIHRDIKPENVLVCDNILKIADFGWSNY